MPSKDGARKGRTILKAVLFSLLTGWLHLLVLPAWMDSSFSQPPGDPATGKQVYERWCAGCHGRTGEGLGHMPDFKDPAYASSHSDQEIFEAVSQGKGGTGMPPFAKRLSEKDRWSVVAYIRTLAGAR